MDRLQVAGGGGVEDVEPVRGIVVEVVPQLVHVLEPHVRVHVVEILTCKRSSLVSDMTSGLETGVTGFSGTFKWS